MAGPSSATPLPWRAIAAALYSALLAAVVVAAADVIYSSWRGPPIALGSMARALVAAIGLYGVAAVAVGLVVGVLFGSIVRLAEPPDGWGRAVRALLSDPRRDRAAAAGLLAVAGSIAFLSAVLLVYDLRVALEMAAKRNAALSTALVAALLVPLSALVWFPLYHLGHWLVALVPRPRLVLVGAGLVLVALTGAGLAVASVEWRVLHFGPFIALGLFLSIELGALVWLWQGRDQPRSPARRLLARSGLGLGLGFLLVGVAFRFAWLHLGSDPRVLGLLGEESQGAKVLLRVARRFADRDHDGYAARLGGGDCNDRDPTIHPDADDLPGNGIDEDCDGADAQVASRPVEARSPEATAYRFTGNLLLITIDTLRADRLNPQTMPALSELSKRAVVFTHAYAQAPNTPRSFPSFLTSRFPSEIRWARPNANFSPILAVPDNTTLFQALEAAGFSNHGVFSHFYLTRENGLGGGFASWDNAGALSLHDSNTDIAAPRIAARVIAQLGELRHQRFALWTHFFDPHSRYMEHPETRSTRGRGLEDKYDGEVAFVDHYLGEIMAALKATGLDKNTAVIVFSDHGEAFGEHRFGGERMYFHGQTLYDELLRVPLVMAVPGLAPRTVDTPVMLVDLAPTLVELVKAARPPSFHGRSLLPALLGAALPPAPIYAELLRAPSWEHHWRVLIDQSWKIIDKISENSLELYHLGADPREQNNLAPAEGARLLALRKKLASFLGGAR